MKTYDEMAESVFERRDEYEKKQKIKRKKLAAVTVSFACVAVALAVGAGVWQGYKKPETVQQAEDAVEPGIKDWYGPGEEPPESDDNNSAEQNDFYLPVGEEPTSKRTDLILVSSFENAGFYSYATPEAGKHFFSVPLKNALEEYGDTAIYQVKVNVFSDNDHIQNAEELVKIAEMLYDLGYTSAIETDTDNYSILTLHATESQLKNFKADDEHGYFFFLYNE